VKNIVKKVILSILYVSSFFVLFSDLTEFNNNQANKKDQGLEIKRKVGLWSGVAFIISRVIGNN